MLRSGANAPGDTVVDLGAVVGTFWRGRWIIAACLAVALPLGLAFALSSEPYYRTRSLLLISPGEGQLSTQISLDSPAATRSPLEEVANETHILTSQPVLERVIERLDLLGSPILNPALAESSGGRLSLPWFDRGDAPMPERAVLRNLGDAVAVEQQGLSQIIAIDVTLADAVLAADIANAMAQAYIDIKKGEMQASLRDTAEWLSSQVVEIESRAQASAAEVERFRISEGLGDATRLDALAIHLSRLTENLTTATQTREALEDRLAEIDDQGRVERERLSSDLKTAKARETALRRSAEEMSTQLGELTRANTKLQQLEQQAAADRFIYERFLEQARQSYALQTLQQTDARILESATVPLSAAGPNKKLILLLAAFLGSSAGAAIVFLRELLRRTLRSREELAQLTGLPVVASLPILPQGTEPIRFLAQIVENPRSEYNEAVRGFRNLILPPTVSDSRVVALTSSVPGEGKSMLSMSLALLTAAGGRKAVILDCDQRLSQFVDQLGLSSDIGLSDVLGDKAGILDAVQVDERFGLHVVPSLRGKEFNPDALATPRLSEAIDVLRRHYDLIILDSPPVVPVSDIGVIARQCDEVYFICRWGRTQRSQTSDALSKLRMLDIDVAGIVFTQVNFEREAAFRGVPYYRYEEYWHG